MYRHSCIALLSLFPFHLSAEDVSIYIWEDYLSEELVQQFEQSTGHTITQHYYEDEITRDKIVMGDLGNNYDLVVIDSFSIPAYLEGEYIHSLHKQPASVRTPYKQSSIAACGIGGIPYMQGSMGIAYRESQFPTAPTSFSDLFDSEFLGNQQLLMPKDDIDTIAIALLALGYHPMSNSKQELAEAYEILNKQKRWVKEYRTSYDYILEHKSQSDINLAIAWSGEIAWFKEETNQDDWVFLVPELGSLNWYDCFAAPTTQPISEAARSFLAFLSTPEFAAMNSQSLWSQSSHAGIDHLLDKEFLSDQSVFTPQSILDKSYQYLAISNEAIQLRTRMMAALVR